MIRYHADIGFPAWWAPPAHRIHLTPTHHALQRANDYGVSLPDQLQLAEVEVVEASFETGSRLWEQLLVRLSFDERRDLCLVITWEGVIKTAWVNLRGDDHPTLDRKRYARP